MSQDEFLHLQQAIDERGHGWYAGPTSLSALPPEEQDLRLGLSLEPEQMVHLATMMAQPPMRAADFPPAWDWRNVDGADWTTPIRDQQACGSCVAFGTVAALETLIKRQQGDSTVQPDLSEAHLFFCGCGDCCTRGWWPTYALEYAQRSGVPDEACFPYQDRYLLCSESCSDWTSRAVKAASWQEVIDLAARKQWLATTGPLIACMAVYRDFFSYVAGVYRHTMGDLAGYHAICVVGYSEAEQAWLCKNSWGTDWGETGWFKIGYNECGIDTQFAMYGVEAVVLPSPGPGPGPDPEPQPGPGCSPWARLLNALGV